MPGLEPKYARPSNGRVHILKQGGVTYAFDNRYVVPHNRHLLNLLACHANLLIVSSSLAPMFA